MCEGMWTRWPAPGSRSRSRWAAARPRSGAGVGLGHGLVAHGHVNVGPGGEGDSPVGHGAVGVEAGRLLERADRLRVVEGEAQGQPLVEVALGVLRAGRDRVAVVAEAVEQW